MTIASGLSFNSIAHDKTVIRATSVTKKLVLVIKCYFPLLHLAEIRRPAYTAVARKLHLLYPNGLQPDTLVD
jgi:hypothetical protein